MKKKINKKEVSPPASNKRKENREKPHPQPFAFLVEFTQRTATVGSPRRGE